MKTLLKRLWRQLSGKRRHQLWILALIMILASFAEILSIGSIIPFLAILTEPSKIYENQLFKSLTGDILISSTDQIIFFLMTLFISAAVFAGVMRILLIWVGTRLCFSIGADLSEDIYRKTLYQPYQIHISRNSSSIIDGITVKTNRVIEGVILPLIVIISSSIMLLFVMGGLLFLQPMISLVSFFGIGLLYAISILLIKKRLLQSSSEIAKKSSQVIKLLQEGLGGVREILLDGTQEIYSNAYGRVDRSMRKSQGLNIFFAQCPRYIVESLGMVLIALMAFYLSRMPEGVSGAIATLGVLALAAQRVLPILQQSYHSWSIMMSNQASLADALDLLEQPLEPESRSYKKSSYIFSKNILIKDLWFRYDQKEKWVLSNINLTIKKGSSYGFIGSTGCGKSTLLDLIMCLLEPTNGSIRFDEHEITSKNKRLLQENISHVPQSIFLIDGTITQNIALGINPEDVDYVRLRRVLECACMAEVIDSLPLKYETIVGERGVRLSGGQRQRIGIARALYKKNVNILILDEATSALDSETELNVIKRIHSLSDDMTILMVAHRLTTLKNCSQIIDIRDGSVAKIGTYQEIILSGI
jgi:ABC-type multidrug transport system fused ATPase/permease subunit